VVECNRRRPILICEEGSIYNPPADYSMCSTAIISCQMFGQVQLTLHHAPSDLLCLPHKNASDPHIIAWVPKHPYHRRASLQPKIEHERQSPRSSDFPILFDFRFIFIYLQDFRIKLYSMFAKPNVHLDFTLGRFCNQRAADTVVTIAHKKSQETLTMVSR